MTELHDHELLAQFASGKSEPAFAALVGRYVPLVYSTALRFADNPANAEEITQAVFIILARKAVSLRRGTILSGWLYQTARLTAANYLKADIRRQHREQEAFVRSTLNTPETTVWEQIAPMLDEAMGQLGETDRNAIVLRFFENKTAGDIAAALKTNEPTAQKRVTRALEKLRKIFIKRGVTLPGTLIAGALAASSVQAAPSGLAASVTTAAAQGTLVSATIVNLVSGTMKMMTWLKLKFAVGMGLATLAVGVAAAVAISQTNEKGSPDYTTFANYLTNRTWLKEFEVVLNNSRYKPEDAQDPDSAIYKGNSTWEASMQPGGFFIKWAGGGWTDPKPSITVGESPTEYWQVPLGRDSIARAPKDPAQGGSEKNGRAIIAEQQKQTLVDILNLGIEGLDNVNIVWNSKNQFTSPLLDMRGRTTHGTVQVTIESSDSHGLPLWLRVASTDGKEKKQIRIHCSYDKPVLPPSKVIVERTVNGKERTLMTNIVRKAVFGLGEDGAKGFSLSDFLEGVSVSREFVESNGVRYVSEQGGRPQLVDDTTLAAGLERNRAEGKAMIAESRKATVARFVIPSVLVLFCALAIYVFVRRRQSLSQKG